MAARDPIEERRRRPKHASSDAARPRIWVEPLATIAGWTAAGLLALFFFSTVTTVVLGLLAAGVVAAALVPLARRVPGGRWLGALVAGVGAVVIVAGVVAILAWLLAGPVQQQLAQWPETRDRINTLLTSWSQTLGLGPSVTLQDVSREVRDLFAGISGGQLVSRASGILIGLGIAAVFIFVAPIYLMGATFDALVRPIQRMLSPRSGRAFEAALTDLVPRLRYWLLGTLLSMVVVGVISWVGYSVVGLRFALPLALLAGLLEIVPTLGPLITLALGVLIAATQGTGQVIGVLIVYGVVQLLESYLILPLVMRKAVHIPPVVTLFTIIFWGGLFGPVGLLLALPLDLAVWSFARHFLMNRSAEAERPADIVPAA